MASTTTDIVALLDRLAELVGGEIPDDHVALQTLVRRQDWEAPDEARQIVRQIRETARKDVQNFVMRFDSWATDPQVMEAWLSADPEPGVPWGLDHDICNVINSQLRKRGLPTGDWTWLEWMRC